MRRLTIIGTTPNGDGVILSDGKGAKFLVANDPRLAAVTDHELSRQMEIALQTFSPREIQSRVRAGASAEVIAAETGWPMEKVLRYAEPLLAERAYIARQAQQVEVRRSGGGATLLEAATAALGPAADTVAISWDAWRREDGKWVITAVYSDRDGPHTAQWSYDHAGRNIHPIDDQARTLMGARPVAVPDHDDLTDALDLIAERPIEAAPARTGSRRRLASVPDASDTGVTPEPAPEVASEAPPAAEPETPAEPTAAAKKPAPRKTKPRKGRASVPSWDEILFGASRPKD